MAGCSVDTRLRRHPRRQAGAGAECGGASSASRGDAPNVLVIVVDTLRADHVSAYGYTRATSPNLDRMAQQGVLFENAVSTSSWSLPSHVSLLTGRYQFEHGIGNVQPAPWLGWGSQGLGGFPTLGERPGATGLSHGSVFRQSNLLQHKSRFRPGLSAFRRLFSFASGHVHSHALRPGVRPHLSQPHRQEQGQARPAFPRHEFDAGQGFGRVRKLRRRTGSSKRADVVNQRTYGMD